MYCMAFIGMAIFNWFSFCYMCTAFFAAITQGFGHRSYYYSYTTGVWSICFSIPAAILNVFNFAFNCKLRKHEMISHRDQGVHPSICRLRTSMAFVILEQVFVTATCLTMCILSNSYYDYYSWANSSWTWVNYIPLMIFGWVMAIGSMYTLCKMKKWE